MVVRIALLVLAAAWAGGETKRSRLADLRLLDLDISRRPPCDGSRLQHLQNLCEHTVVKISCWCSKLDAVAGTLSSDCGKSSLPSVKTFAPSALNLFAESSVLFLQILHLASFWESAPKSILAKSVLHILENFTSFAFTTDEQFWLLQT